MSTFVLVHGAWQDASCWSGVANPLRERGHTVITPDLPGHGSDPTALSGQTLEAYAAAITRVIDAAGAPVVLVGHSMGGAVISTVAEARPDAITRLVYVAAYLLADGESIQQVSATDAESRVPAAMRPSADWSTVAIDGAMAADVFCNGCSPEATRAAVLAMAAEATAPFATPVHITPARFGRVPRSYIATRQDRAVSPALQERMRAALPCTPVLTMDTGHLPFAADPHHLAAHLHTLSTP